MVNYSMEVNEEMNDAEGVSMSQSEDRHAGFLPALERALSGRGQWSMSKTESVLLNMFSSMMSAYAARLGLPTNLSEQEHLQKAIEYSDELGRLKFGKG